MSPSSPHRKAPGPDPTHSRRVSQAPAPAPTPSVAPQCPQDRGQARGLTFKAPRPLLLPGLPCEDFVPAQVPTIPRPPHGFRPVPPPAPARAPRLECPPPPAGRVLCRVRGWRGPFPGGGRGGCSQVLLPLPPPFLPPPPWGPQWPHVPWLALVPWLQAPSSAGIHQLPPACGPAYTQARSCASCGRAQHWPCWVAPLDGHLCSGPGS